MPTLQGYWGVDGGGSPCFGAVDTLDVTLAGKGVSCMPMLVACPWSLCMPYGPSPTRGPSDNADCYYTADLGE